MNNHDPPCARNSRNIQTVGSCFYSLVQELSVSRTEGSLVHAVAVTSRDVNWKIIFSATSAPGAFHGAPFRPAFSPAAEFQDALNAIR